MKSYQWLKKAELKGITEALIIPAQELALSTKFIEVEISHTRKELVTKILELQSGD